MFSPLACRPVHTHCASLVGRVGQALRLEAWQRVCSPRRSEGTTSAAAPAPGQRAEREPEREQGAVLRAAAGHVAVAAATFELLIEIHGRVAAGVRLARGGAATVAAGPAAA